MKECAAELSRLVNSTKPGMVPKGKLRSIMTELEEVKRLIVSELEGFEVPDSVDTRFDQLEDRVAMLEDQIATLLKL